MPNLFENLFKGRVITANVIFTLLAFAFAYNVTMLPTYVVMHPKTVDPKLAEKIIDFSTTGLVGIVGIIIGRLIPTNPIKEDK